MTEESNERRQAARIETDLPLSVGDGQPLSCRVVNLSRTGALAIADRALDEMAVVQIAVRVTDDDGSDRTFGCEAAVVRCDRRPDGHFDVGLYFTSITAGDRAILERLTSNPSKLSPAPL